MGELMALLAALSFASANVMVKKGTTPHSKDNGTFLSLLLTFFISGIMFAGMGMKRGWPALTSEGLLWFIFAGALTSFIGRTLLYSSIQQLGSVRASAIKRLNPFFTVLIGVFFLHEPLNIVIFLGMIFIFGSSLTLIFESLKVIRRARKETATAVEYSLTRQSGSGSIWVKWIKVLASLGYLYGVVSALAYSVGYVVRKEGLSEIPDPYLGTIVGAFVGIVIFIFLSLFQERYRQSVRSAFSGFHPWLFGAGIATSLGQILYFAALTYSSLSQVALIASTDVILTLFLSAWVFKTQEGITKTVILASFIAMMGAGLIAIG